METEFEYVARKLRDRTISLPQISAETGLTVAWLSSIARGLIVDPGVRKVAKATEYFRLLDLQEAQRLALREGGLTERGKKVAV